MSDLKFSVKDKSLNQFFIDNGIDFVQSNNRNQMEINPYYLMKDELFIKQGTFVIDQVIEFELYDVSRNSQKDLTNHYVYRVMQYDDVCFKLILIDFQITIKP